MVLLLILFFHDFSSDSHTQAETSFAELGQEEQRKRSQEWAMLLAMAAMPAIDTALHGKSGTIYGNNIYDNLESQGTQDIYKGSTTSWKPPVDTVGGGNLKIIDGKIGGKIPIEDFDAIRTSSVKNPGSKSITLGKYTEGADSYIAKAGKDSSYFDLGSDWSKIQNKYKLTDSEMFEYFNKPALNDGFLGMEWEHIKSIKGLKDSNLIFEGGFWIVKY